LVGIRVGQQDGVGQQVDDPADVVERTAEQGAAGVD
jgi:hypothetical protein